MLTVLQFFALHQVFEFIHRKELTNVDDNLVLAELGAIIEYIIAKHGNGRLGLGNEELRVDATARVPHCASRGIPPH